MLILLLIMLLLFGPTELILVLLFILSCHGVVLVFLFVLRMPLVLLKLCTTECRYMYTYIM